VLVAHPETNTIDAYRTSDCRFLGRVNNTAAAKDATLTPVATTSGSFVVYSCKPKSNLLCNFNEFNLLSLQDCAFANSTSTTVKRISIISLPTFQKNDFVFHCVSVNSNNKLIACAYLNRIWIVSESHIKTIVHLCWWSRARSCNFTADYCICCTKRF
jgi:hypothetical protein